MQLDDFTINCILLFLSNKKKSQNVVRTSVIHLTAPRVPFFLLFFPHFDVIRDLHVLLYRLTATWNLLF